MNKEELNEYSDEDLTRILEDARTTVSWQKESVSHAEYHLNEQRNWLTKVENDLAIIEIVAAERGI